MTTEENKKLSLLVDDLSSLEDYIHDLFNFSPLPICFVSPIGVLLEVNPSFEAISNLKPHELVGEPVEELFKKEEIESVAKETLAKGFVSGKEISFFPKEGKKITAQVFTKVRKDKEENAVGYFLCLFDLAGIKKAEEELKKENKRLKEELARYKK